VLQVGRLPKSLALRSSQPVPQPNAELLYPFDAPDACRKIGAQQTTVGGLIGKTTDSAQSKVNSAWSQSSGFEVRAIT
jgi:hypothetical protein